MGLLGNAADELTDRRAAAREAAEPDTTGPTGQTASLNARESTVTIGGDEVKIENIDTQQSGGEGNWLTGTHNEYGIPRGIEAVEHRQIVQTSAMQSIVNGIAGQILGGELTFQTDDDAMDALGPQATDRAEQFRTLLRDILEGPHLPDRSLDQLITAAVEDMVGPGQAVWQLLGSEDGSIPVAAMQTLDPLTVRMNIDEHNQFGDTPYWQAQGAFAGEMGGFGAIDPVPLGFDDVVLLDYPYGSRSYQPYPISPAWQVREWLEILANSTTHHNRFYADNEIPPGLIQVVGASGNTIADIKEKIEAASGDPRDVPVVGGEGGAQWLDMGGTAVNLNVIEEQKWFYQLCLGSLGLGKAEVGLIEDVNRSNGEIESERVFKRVGGPFTKQFEKAFLKVARQFDVFRDLGEPYTPTLSYSDPREERAREQRLREMYQAGGLSLREYVRRRGDADLAEDEDRYTVEIGDETIDYGDHPRWVAQAMLQDAGQGVEIGGDPDEPDNGGE